MSKQNVNGEPIHSLFADDPEMHELISYFVQELPDRARTVAELWRERNLEDLQRMAHQLKGACGGYGFTPVGVAAERLEDSLKSEADIDAIGEQVTQLIDLCRRVAA